MVKIIWVCNDSFGISVYYPAGTFGQAFDEFMEGYVVHHECDSYVPSTKPEDSSK